MVVSKEKKIKNTIIFLIIFILIIAGVVIISYEKIAIESQIKSDLSNQNKNIDNTFNFFIEELDNDVTNHTDLILHDFAREAFFKKDREKLYNIVKPDFQKLIQSNSYLKTISFILPNGRVFLRVHKPNIYGDKLNEKREIILDTIKHKQRQYGFEVGKVSMTHRVVTPVYYKGDFLGVVEVGIEPEYIINKMNHIFNIKSSLLVKEDDLFSSKVDTDKKVGEFVFVRGSKIVENNLDKINLLKNSFRITYDDKEYYLNIINLLDHKGEVSAKMVISYDLTKFNKKSNQLLIQKLVLTFFVIVSLFFILNVGLNYYLKKIDKLYLNVINKDKMIFEQSKLAAMGEMIGNIAHQWRQPLSMISASASGLKLQHEHGLLNDEIFNKSIDGIVHSTTYLSQTIDDFMGFLKQNKKEVEFNIKKNIDKNLSILSGSLKTHSIKVIVQTYDETIIGFPNELTQVFLNIVHNAKDALKNCDVDNRYIFINTSTQNENLIIKIKDNANGIDENIINKIFEPYFTTKADNEGTGLGLYMSYRIITESMKGKIEVKNVKYSYNDSTNIGAEFTIILPLKKQIS